MVRGHITWVRSLIAALAVMFVSLVVPAGSAMAHTDFDFSLPTDGAVVGDPVSEIRVGFTLPVTLVGNGFEVLDPQGEIRQPFAVTDDDTVFRLQMDPPLAAGDVGVRWEVRAADGHVLSGSFAFTVDSPLVTTTTPGPTTLAEPVAPTTAVPTPLPTNPPDSIGGGDQPVPSATTALTPTTTAPTTDVPHDSSDMAETTAASPSSAGAAPSRGGDRHTDLYAAGFMSLVVGLGAFAILRREPAA